MPITIRQNTVKFKDQNGQYHGLDVLTDHTATESIAAVNSAGATQISAIQAKGQETIESIPSDYTTLSEEVSDLRRQLEILLNRNEVV